MAIERKFVKDTVHRLLVQDFVRKETQRAGFGGLDIQRTPLGTRVNITAERPGMVIGRRGVTINQLTSDLNKKFDLENPQLSVEEPESRPELNAEIMAFKVAESLERGWHFRRVGHSTVQRIMAAGAEGCIIEIAGKLTGAKRRREKFIAGHIKYCGETAYELMDSAHSQCKKKLGVIGCTVRIMKKGAVLPDVVKIHDVASAAAVQHVSETVAEDAPAAEAAPEAAPVSKEPLPEGLETMTVTQLKDLASERNVAINGGMRKAEIVEALTNSVKGTAAPARRERKSFTVEE